MHVKTKGKMAVGETRPPGREFGVQIPHVIFDAPVGYMTRPRQHQGISWVTRKIKQEIRSRQDKDKTSKDSDKLKAKLMDAYKTRQDNIIPSQDCANGYKRPI
jgi:hypothetical protein